MPGSQMEHPTAGVEGCNLSETDNSNNYVKIPLTKIKADNCQ